MFDHSKSIFSLIESTLVKRIAKLYFSGSLGHSAVNGTGPGPGGGGGGGNSGLGVGGHHGNHMTAAAAAAAHHHNNAVAAASAAAASLLVVPQPINASKMGGPGVGGTGGHAPAGGSGRKYQCKMCPQVS